jgi:hypothetical protein
MEYPYFNKGVSKMGKRFFSWTGVSLRTVLLLALLGAPRVIAHDLGLVEPNGAANQFLVFAPAIMWIAYVVWKKAKKPFIVLFSIGLCYGFYVGVIHQLFLGHVFGDSLQLGGNLRHLSSTAAELIARPFAFISSVATGAGVGLIVGVIGAAVNRIELFLRK